MEPNKIYRNTTVVLKHEICGHDSKVTLLGSHWQIHVIMQTVHVKWVHGLWRWWSMWRWWAIPVRTCRVPDMVGSECPGVSGPQRPTQVCVMWLVTMPLKLSMVIIFYLLNSKKQDCKVSFSNPLCACLSHHWLSFHTFRHFCRGSALADKKKQLMEMIARKRAELEAKAAGAEQPLFLVWLAPGSGCGYDPSFLI